MTAYKVLVSHRDLRMKSVVHLEPTEQVRYLVEAGYLKAMEDVQHVGGTARPGHEESGTAGLRAGDVDHDLLGGSVPRKSRKVLGKPAKVQQASEVVADEPDRAVSDAGPADSEE